MTLTLPVLLSLAAQCAPGVAPETLLSVALAESRFDPLAIGVNGGSNPPASTTVSRAARIAKRYIAAGYSVDLGLAQINSRNLGWVGLSVDDAFDPCRNLAAAARLLATNYATARRQYAEPAALGVALSMYNTGDAHRGYHNGYVDRVYRTATQLVPAITGAPQTATPAADRSIPMGNPLDPASGSDVVTMITQPSGRPPRRSSTPARSPPPTAAASWDVFATARNSSSLIFKGVD